MDSEATLGRLGSIFASTTPSPAKKQPIKKKVPVSEPTPVPADAGSPEEPVRVEVEAQIDPPVVIDPAPPVPDLAAHLAAADAAAAV